MTKIENLIEQTSFLSEKQAEAQKECAKLFADLTSVVKEKIDEGKESEETSNLEKIHQLLAKHSQGLNQEIQDDIDFLHEQLTALKTVHQIQEKDPDKAQELLNMIIDEGEELKDIDSFKRDVSEELITSKQNFISVVNDITTAIEEGSGEEVVAYLEAIFQTPNQIETECCESETCGSECGLSHNKEGEMCGDTGCDEGINVFAKLDRDDDLSGKKED